jgi:hypothetical protein
MMDVNLVPPNLNILEEYEIAGIEDITLLAVESPLWTIVLSPIPPEVSRNFVLIKLISSNVFQSNIGISTRRIVDFDNCLLNESKNKFF